MKRGALIFVILWIVISVLNVGVIQAQEQSNSSDIVYKSNYDYLELDVEISNEIYAKDTTATIDVFIFPKDSLNQEIYGLSLEDFYGNEIPYSEDNGKITFKIISKDYIEGFKIKTKLKTKYFNPEIKEKISLRDLLNTLPEDLIVYAYSSSEDYTDYRDPYIRNKAEQLAYTDDMLEVLHNLAEYVKTNMQYDLQETDLKKASEIMRDKRGVCSHYTILFMALARSLGIPVRYVTGLAYSNYENKFREHAWAEVWLGENYGWIPYDPTFGEYGWIDPYHIKLKESLDAGTKAIEYKYSGGKIEPGAIVINTTILNYGELKQTPLLFTIKPIVVETGLDSYVPLEIRASNHYYLSWPVRLNSAPDYFGPTQKTILLKPNEENLGYFLIHTPSSRQCENGCISDLIVTDIFENSAKSQLLFRSDKASISLEDAQKIVSPTIILGANVDLFCKSEKKYYYEYETARMICIIENNEDKTREISLCLNDICKTNSVSPNSIKEETIEFNIRENEKRLENFTQPMTSMIKCILSKENQDLVGISCIDFVILKTPHIQIEPISTTRIKYGGKIIVPMNITANTNIDLTLKIMNSELKYEDFDILWLRNGKQTTGFMIDSLKMKNLKPGEYDLRVMALYLDKNNQSYQEQTNIPIQIEDTNFFNKLWVGIKKIFV
ncbi:transglutaminase domain-containing protein [Candidatus Pacearchaeota archaeon]|nr:transglutaminase domain-containing protein [Candidatus Pacearchaeota archaeon]